jgi:hypothetical protein
MADRILREDSSGYIQREDATGDILLELQTVPVVIDDDGPSSRRKRHRAFIDIQDIFIQQEDETIMALMAVIID